MLCEIKSFLSRIWTHIAVSISHDDNHYTIIIYQSWIEKGLQKFLCKKSDSIYEVLLFMINKFKI